LFAKLWLSPYLDIGPEDVFTVENDGQVGGYLVACFSDHYTLLVLRANWRWLIVMIARSLLGRYRHHPPSARFVRWLLFRSWRETPRTPRQSGHFHFNLVPELRGNEIGDCLLRAFEQRLIQKGRNQWHGLVFTSENHRSLRLYKRLGFEVYDTRPCSLFAEPSEVLCVRKCLAK
jgi:ribosomal protein S18 acetylase RimI-like enzyme